jgi:hypothetical protein
MKEQYKKLKEKNALPSFEDLDREFEIATIETENLHLPREIVKKTDEKIEFIIAILEEIINPERLGSLQESAVFNEENKKEILAIYKELNYYHRQNSCLEISYDEKENIEFIKNFFQVWQKISPKAKSIIGKMRDTWKDSGGKKPELNFYG